MMADKKDKPYKGLGEWYSQGKGPEARRRGPSDPPLEPVVDIAAQASEERKKRNK